MPMTSKRKIEANRRNAKLSTGPKTARGKSSSCKNAFKHGLASLAHRPVERAEDEELLETLAPAGSCQEQRELAFRVLEATRSLDHARLVRAKVAGAFEGTSLDRGGVRNSISRIERYEVRAQARLRKAAKRLLVK
jgi:hypothetical protein